MEFNDDDQLTLMEVEVLDEEIQKTPDNTEDRNEDLNIQSNDNLGSFPIDEEIQQTPDNTEDRNEDLNIQTDDNPDDPDYDRTPILGRVKRKRRKVAEPQEWRDNKNMKLREMGKNYEGWSGKKRGSEREGRKMGGPCKSNFCLKSSTRKCNEVTEDDREILFKEFWETLNWDQKRIYIISLLKYSEKNTTRKKPGEESRRQATVIYHLKCPNGKNVQVCKKLFLSTFSLGEWTVLNWISENFKKGNNGMTPSKNVVLQQRRESNPRRSFKNNDGKEVLKSFIESLPKLPSHYCRKNTSKVYLEPVYGDNMLGVFNEYKRLCKENEAGPVHPVSRCTFDKLISELNLSFQQPKKDRCDKCIMFEVGSLTEEQYKKHIDAKNRAREEKDYDKKKAIEGSAVVLTMDVQAVKVCPSLNASALYYKTKLCCHNFTIYDLASHAATCYWFNETQTDLSANTFASCIIDYLSENCDGSKPIIIWSDGCTSQNRNKTLSNALLSYSEEKKVEIEQKFLVKGHTQMEVDSVHSLIERKLKNKSIHLPSDFLRITKEARCTPEPYRVKELTFDFTKNYGGKNLLVYDNIRPGKKPTDPKVTHIRAIKYNNGKIYTKTNFDEDFKTLPHRARKPCSPLSTFPQMFNSPLKIQRRKWQDLQELKSVIPSDCHLFYDHLPYD